MRKLFVIGNGFDRAHGLDTGYEAFHEFLRSNYPDASEEDATVPGFSCNGHGEMVYDMDAVVGYWMQVISRVEGEEWNKFESTLGEMDYGEDFDWLPPQYDKDGDRNPWHELYNNEDLAAQIAGCAPHLQSMFASWVNSIRIEAVKVKDSVKRLISPNDLFLSFNYTLVLEEIYRVPASNICHIHGVQGQTIVFGHGNEEHLFDEEYGSPYIGSEDGLEYIHDLFRKDTAKALREHSSFFQRLNADICSIYSYGFSFSPVDEPYIRKICGCVDTTNIVWYLHNHDFKKHEKQMETIRKCGFQGEFDTFGEKES